MEYLDFYVTKNKCKFDILTWNKTNPLPTYANKYVNDVEYILYFTKGKGHCFPQCYTDAFHYYLSPINSVDKKKYKHPTIKPLEFTKRLIRNSSRENDVILDCFMGSGTTGVACKELDRNFIGIEINEEFFNIAKERIISIGDNMKEKIKVIDGKYKDCYGEIVNKKEDNTYNVIIQKDWFLWQVDLKEDEFEVLNCETKDFNTLNNHRLNKLNKKTTLI